MRVTKAGVTTVHNAMSNRGISKALLLDLIALNEQEWNDIEAGREVDENRVIGLFKRLELPFKYEYVYKESLSAEYKRESRRTVADCRVIWKEYKNKLRDALIEMEKFIEMEKDRPLPDDGAFIAAVSADYPKLKYFIENAKPKYKEGVIYVTEDDYSLICYYAKYSIASNKAVSRMKQRLTESGVQRLLQSIKEEEVNYHTLLSDARLSLATYSDIINLREVEESDIKWLFKSLQIAPEQNYVAYPISADKTPPIHTIYKNKHERNAAIVAAYQAGKGLRQLEREGFGVKRAAICSILKQAGVYKGEEQGKERNAAGNWDRYQNEYVRAEKMAESKRTDSRQIRNILFDKRIGARMSQQQMAEYLGCSKPYYNAIENGKVMPAEAMWSKIESLFGVEKNYRDTTLLL